MIELNVTNDIAVLEADWNRLSTKNPNVFMTYDWMRVWGGNFEAVTVKRDGQIVGIAPLIRSGRDLRTLDSPADYNDLIIGEGLDEFLAYIKHYADWNVMRLNHFRLTDEVKYVLREVGFKYQARTEPHKCPYFPILTNWSKMTNNKTLRNLRNRLAKGGFRARLIEDPDDEPDLLDKMIVLEQQKRIGRKPVQPFLSRYKDKFKSLFATLGQKGWIYVAVMEIHDTPIAWQMGYRCGSKLWDYQKAYDRRYQTLSPGTALMGAVVDYGLNHGYDEYDCLRGEEGYKMRWCVGSRELSQVEIRKC